jgi:hypothetical protein
MFPGAVQAEGTAIVVQGGTALRWLNKPCVDLAEVDMRQRFLIILPHVLLPHFAELGAKGSYLLAQSLRVAEPRTATHHRGNPVTERILELSRRRGARPAGCGKWSVAEHVHLVRSREGIWALIRYPRELQAGEISSSYPDEKFACDVFRVRSDH